MLRRQSAPVLPKVALLFALTFGMSLQAQTVVIVAASNPISKMKAEEIAQIFMGQTTTFPSGTKAEPLDLYEASKNRFEFCTKFLGKNVSQVKAHWSKISFSGKGQAPAVVGGPAEMVKMVAKDPRYIGYVDQSAVDASVKVIVLQ